MCTEYSSIAQSFRILPPLYPFEDMPFDGDDRLDRNAHKVMMQGCSTSFAAVIVDVMRLCNT